MTNIAKKLGKHLRLLWKIAIFTKGIAEFSFKNLKKIILGTNSVSLMQLLPLFPPVYVGFRVFFGAFWPKRILFFSAKQVCIWCNVCSNILIKLICDTSWHYILFNLCKVLIRVTYCSVARLRPGCSTVGCWLLYCFWLQ